MRDRHRKNTNLSDALYSYRALHRIELEDLADIIGISRDTVKRIEEEGHVNFKDDTIKKIVNWLLDVRPGNMWNT